MAMDKEEPSFLARWSRRKAQSRDGESPSVRNTPAAAATGPIAAHAARGPAAVVPVPDALAPSARHPASPDTAKSAETAGEAATRPLPSLQDVAELNRDSDFRPFVAREVDPSVRNAALHKLFSDPHFNVMDGLDVYIDDYGKPDPLPAGMLQQMVQSRALGLFDTGPQGAEQGPAQEQDGARLQDSDTLRDAHQDIHQDIHPNERQGSHPDAVHNPAPDAPGPSAPESRTLPAERQPDEDPDLRLQSNHPTEHRRGDGDLEADAAAHPGGQR